MRLHTKVILVAAAFTSALALAACGDASVGSHGEYRTAGGDPSGDPAASSGGSGGGDSTGGGGGGGTSTGTSTTGTSGGSFAVTLGSSTVDTEVQATNSVTITLAASGGFAGTVNLAATGLPTGVTAAFTPAAVDLSSGSGTSTMSLTVPSTTVPSSTPSMITVTGDGGGGATANAPLALTVKRAITIVIPPNVEATPNAFGTSDIVVHTGASGISAGNPFVVNFKNLDTSKADGHEIHSDTTNTGFFHGTANIMPNQTNGSDGPRSVTSAATYHFYMHGETDSSGVQNLPDGNLKIVTP